MILKKVKYHIVLGIFLLGTSIAQAKTHTWIPTERTAQSGYTLPPVVVIGERINWGQGYFDDTDFSPSDSEPYYGSSSLGQAIAGAKERALDLANVCKNPFVSQDTKNVTVNSSVDSRWFAATDVFNTIQMNNLWQMYGNASRISVIVDGRNYQGFTVTYGDGSKETWLVNPAHMHSSLKLHDSPLPGSQKPAAPGTGCTQG